MAQQDHAPFVTRRSLLKKLSAAGGSAALVNALAAFHVPPAIGEEADVRISRDSGRNRKVVILGAGVGGLIAGLELQRCNFQCTILEANPIVGGRNLSLRPGDILEEVPEGGSPTRQRCTFEHEDGGASGFYDQPYLNAGPGRIPSAHVHVLRYCQELRIPLEVYIMESRSNLVGDATTKPGVPNRHLLNDARGWISQMLFQLKEHPSLKLTGPEQKALGELLIRFGALDEKGQFVKDKKYTVSTRSGYDILPEVHPGRQVTPFSLQELLASGFWKSGVYQPEDWYWQPTLLQPVGGMDRIVRTLKDAYLKAGGKLHTSSEVTAIAKRDAEFVINTQSMGRREIHSGFEFCIGNIPIPLLQRRLGVQFERSFQDALQAVYKTQNDPPDNDPNKRFLANTAKVGWQADRQLWQGVGENRPLTVPVFGGISFTSDPITQIWYPSDRFHDRLGVLTGAYNYQKNALEYGKMEPAVRLKAARNGAITVGGTDFSKALKHGITIAWQNMPFQRGGWTQWQYVDPNRAVRARHYNRLLAGDNNFFICGDQLSQLPGWMEGAIVSALVAVNNVGGVKTFQAVDDTPDSRRVVEGQ